MIAKRLEALLGTATKHSEADMVQRFQKLRDSGLLPKSRGKNAEDLSDDEVVSGILSVVAARPGWVGVTVKMLKALRPVGGPTASFTRAETFGSALRTLLSDEDALNSLVEIRVTDSEVYKNSHGRAAIVYRAGNKERTSYYVRKEAVSHMRQGADEEYDPRDLISDVIVETTYLPRMIKRIVRELSERRRYIAMTNRVLV